MSEFAKCLAIARRNNLENMAREIAARILAGEYLPVR